MNDKDEIVLEELSLEELYELMHEDLYFGYAEEIEEEVQEALSRGIPPHEIVTDGLVAGMDVVGADFRDGILFIPEVLLAAKAMKAGMKILKPLLTETGAPKVGTMVIGTVKGDIHDIGKNLVGMMMEGAGFEVIDIGINNSAEDYLAAIDENNPDILGMSALLTTTMTYMRVVIQSLKDAGIRHNIIVLVGGAPLDNAFAEDIEADAYCRDAAVAVDKAKKFMAIKRGEISR
jgi:corrinoid protein of di/trimethylamine methyltransferase